MVRYLDSVLSRTGYVPAPPTGDQLAVWRTAGPLVQARVVLFLAQRTGHAQEPAALADLSAVLRADLATGAPSPVLAATAVLEDHPHPRAVLGRVLDVAARAHTPGRVCPFCAIAAGADPLAKVVSETDETVAFVPRDPATSRYGGVTDGHLLVVPKVHVPDMLSVPEVTGTVMREAATLARANGIRNVNGILNVGALATATVRDHMHAHLVPRREGDGLPLPWDPHARQGRPAPASAPQ
uniref:PNPL1.3c n=2 Tax=Nocardiopsis sp. 25L-1-1c TaxID=1009683 RepID=R4HCI3_9ACTN|nr:pNPL1.3c [Nocardiopsis sp. 25L-1-1c]